jgi:hypothetical protein
VIATVMAAVVLVAAFIKGAIGFDFPALGTPDADPAQHRVGLRAYLSLTQQT